MDRLFGRAGRDTVEQLKLSANPAARRTAIDLLRMFGGQEALGLDDPTVLDPPRAIPESFIPRRDLYQQYWSEVLAS